MGENLFKRVTRVSLPRGISDVVRCIIPYSIFIIFGLLNLVLNISY